MTLRKLLLGTSAAMFVGGASITTAQAADPNPAGLVVTTMANYVEQCNNGNGWKKRDWCITLAGSMEFRATLGTKITYSTDPWNSSIADAATSTFDLFGQPFSYFGLTPQLTLTVSKATDAGNLTLVYDIDAMTATSLSIGPWQFTSNSIRYRNTYGPVTVTATLGEPGRLGWNDPRGSAYNASWNGPWPDFALDFAFDAGPAEVTAGMNIGQRTNNMDAFRFVTVGGYVQGEFGAGPADMTVRMDFDRVNAAEDGNGQPVFAFGFMAEAELAFGNITITPSVGWSRNYGYYGYKYTEHERGNYLMAGLDVEAELGDTLTLTTGVEFTRGPDHAFDAVIEANAGLRYEPAGASPLYVTLVGTYQRQLGSQQLSAWNVALSVGAAF